MAESPAGNMPRIEAFWVRSSRRPMLDLPKSSATQGWFFFVAEVSHAGFSARYRASSFSKAFAMCEPD